MNNLVEEFCSSGTIALICNMYVILDQKMKINCTPLYYSLLPQDTVEYTVNNNMINITKILSRKKQYLLGIVKKIENNKAILFCPNYPKFFEPIVPNNNYNIHTSLLLEFTLDNITVVKVYNSIKDRLYDKEIILDLYRLNIYPYEIQTKNDTNHYTIQGCIDMTHLNTFNVDPTHSKDFDDAISIVDNTIYVHIVNAHDMLPINSNVDNDAYKNSFTLYTPEHIENILPKEMAENKLSLIKGEPRNVITIEYQIDSNMDIIKYEIYRSTIIIKNRYDYNEFNTILYQVPLLVSFYEKWKRSTLDIPHIKYNINDMGTIDSYYCESNTDDAHKIIETLMILTNMTISQHMKNNIPQRYHSKLKGNMNSDVENITGNNIIDNILMVKKYKNALYSNNDSGHFGLNISSYTHFTSPIRRYFDVIVHRMLAGVTYDNIDIILEYINTREQYVDKIVKLYNNLKLYSYLEKNINDTYISYIINITNSGVVCIIKEFLFEVFIFTKNMYSESKAYHPSLIKDAKHLYLKYAENSCQYKIGDMVMIKIKSIIWETMEIKGIII